MSDTTALFNKQLPKNAIMSALSFATYALSAVWLTPYLVNHLGVAAYGLIPLAGLFTQLVSIVTRQISGAVNRFLTIEIHKPDGNPNSVFNTAFALYLILVLIQLPLFFVGILYVDKIFSFPPELKMDVQLLLGCSAGAFLISMVGGVFGTSSFSKNRIDIGAGLGTAFLIARLLLILFCFTLWEPKLRFIGFIDLGLGALGLVASILICRKLTPELGIAFRLVDWKILIPLFKMSVWTLVKQVGALLYLRSDIWIINKFISPAAAGQYAAILVLINFIKQLGNLAVHQVYPTMMAYFAKEEVVHLAFFVNKSIKYMTLFLAVIVGVVCGLSRELLPLWLGPDFKGLEPLVWVLAAPLFINIGFTFLYPLQITYNKVTLPALVTLMLGFLNVLGSYYFGVVCSLGFLGVALVTSLVLTANDAFFTPIYCSKKMLKISLLELYAPVLPAISIFLLSFLFTKMHTKFITHGGWGAMVLGGAGSALFTLPFVMFFVPRSDWQWLMKTCKRIMGVRGNVK